MLLSLTILLAQAQASCHTADIINTIGGTTYTVDQITATHATTATEPFLVVAGKFTKEAGSIFGFLYLYDYNECRVKRTYEFPSINQGFTDVSFQRGKILAVGYRQFKRSKLQEVLVLGTVEEFLTTR